MHSSTTSHQAFHRRAVYLEVLGDRRVRLEAVRQAAVYVHPKMTATGLTVMREQEPSLEKLKAKLRMHFDTMDPALLSELMGSRLESSD